jgi:DNA-binding NarL/FixJ family response regulator
MRHALRILLVDDHPLLREGVARALEVQPGWQVVAQADTGAQALVQARAHRPDVALLDLSMPPPTGAGLLQELLTWLPALRVVVLTASSDTDSLLSALDAGAHGYVIKGVSGRELRSIVSLVASGGSYVPPSMVALMPVPGSRHGPQGFDPLTAREAEVLLELSRGRSNRDIGLNLAITEKTVKHHVTQVLAKLQVRSRTEAALLAQSWRLK